MEPKNHQMLKGTSSGWWFQTSVMTVITTLMIGDAIVRTTSRICWVLATWRLNKVMRSFRRNAASVSFSYTLLAISNCEGSEQILQRNRSSPLPPPIRMGKQSDGYSTAALKEYPVSLSKSMGAVWCFMGPSFRVRGLVWCGGWYFSKGWVRKYGPSNISNYLMNKWAAMFNPISSCFCHTSYIH